MPRNSLFSIGDTVFSYSPFLWSAGVSAPGSRPPPPLKLPFPEKEKEGAIGKESNCLGGLVVGITGVLISRLKAFLSSFKVLTNDLTFYGLRGRVWVRPSVTYKRKGTRKG